MKFLKNIAIAALVTTAFAGTVMAAAPDLLLVANGGPAKSKFTLSVDNFERAHTKAGFSAKSSDVALEIADRVVAGVVGQVMAIDGVTYDDAGKVVALVKAKNADAEQEIAFGAKLKLAGADAELVKEAVDGLVAKIVAKLGLKDKDEAAIEAIAVSPEWDAVKDFEFAPGQTLEKLASKPKTAKGVKVLGNDLSAVAADLKGFAAHVAKAKLIAERDGHAAKVIAHGKTITAHEATIAQLRQDVLDEAAKPKTDPLHKAAFDVLAQFEQDLEDNGFDGVSLPGYVKGKTAENIEAFFQLNVKLAAAVEKLKKDLAAAKLAPVGKVVPSALPSLDGAKRPAAHDMDDDAEGSDHEDALASGLQKAEEARRAEEQAASKPKGKKLAKVISRAEAAQRAEQHGEDHTDDAILAQHAKALGGTLAE